MSKIARKPIPIPDGVEVSVDGNKVSVKGKRGEMFESFPFNITVEQTDEGVYVRGVETSDEKRVARSNVARLGLVWKLIYNMVEGVSTGFKKVLVIEGIGYRAQQEGSTLVLQLGHSHDVRLDIPEGLTVTADPGDRNKNPQVIVEGVDKALVGFFADKVLRARPAEPYKGKGVFYEGHPVRRKEGKAAAK